MRIPAWRIALVAALTCLALPLLQATEASLNGSTPEIVAAPTAPKSPASTIPKTTSDLPQVSNTPVEKKSIAPATPGMDEFGRLLGYVTLLAALAGGAIYLIKFGIPLHRNRSKEERKLQVLEMRPLGNRQFLIVVGYEDTRMLLGVTPGKIDYLCALDSISTSAVDFSQLVDQSEKIRAAQ